MKKVSYLVVFFIILIVAINIKFLTVYVIGLYYKFVNGNSVNLKEYHINIPSEYYIVKKDKKSVLIGMMKNDNLFISINYLNKINDKFRKKVKVSNHTYTLKNVIKNNYFTCGIYNANINKEIIECKKNNISIFAELLKKDKNNFLDFLRKVEFKANK